MIIRNSIQVPRFSKESEKDEQMERLKECLNESASIAEAALELSGIFEAAQDAET